ncbi:hypothetical protein LguiA_002100 [Lonicera macranthoides]
MDESGVIKFFGCRVNALSCRVEIALKMKGVDYEYVEDPNLGMPVFLHNGKSIAECGVILEYIEENWKLLIPTLWKAFLSKGREQGEAIEVAFMQLKDLEQQLQGKKFFGGNSIGLADITANFIAYWVGIIQELTGIPLLTKAKYPKLCEWVEDFVSCPIVKDMLPPKHDLVGFFQATIQGPPPSSMNYQ